MARRQIARLNQGRRLRKFDWASNCAFARAFRVPKCALGGAISTVGKRGDLDELNEKHDKADSAKMHFVFERNLSVRRKRVHHVFHIIIARDGNVQRLKHIMINHE